MRVWIDITAPAHVLVFRPLLRLLAERGADVLVTSRRYRQAVELLELHGIAADLLGAHGGGSALGKVEAMAGRLPALVRWGRGRRFDVAIAHGSHELMIAARTLGVPGVTMFDYEWATWQHQLGCRAARRVVVPDVIPSERLRQYGVRPVKLRQYPGLKEEYYLTGFEPDPSVLDAVGADSRRVVAVVRTPAEFANYHLGVDNTVLPAVLQRLGRDDRVHAIVLPRNEEQRAAVRALGLPSLLVPEHAVDAQSLIALADVVVSAGGTMNREAAALGVPVYTTFAGRLGAVDEWLLETRRLRRLVDVDSLRLEKRRDGGSRIRRDPSDLLELLVSGLVR